jgi:hypothetical protein
VKNAATGQSVQAVVVDFDQPSSSNNLADVSQAVIDSLWPGYINGDLVNGYPLYAEIEYTGQFVPGMDFAIHIKYRWRCGTKHTNFVSNKHRKRC